MASLMEDLINVLNQEEEQYQGLIELGKKKREVVIRADIKTLDEITATEQEAASNLQNLAKKRARVLNDMATVLGRNPGEVTITKMISYLEEQPVEQKQLMEVKERLRPCWLIFTHGGPRSRNNRNIWLKPKDTAR